MESHISVCIRKRPKAGKTDVINIVDNHVEVHEPKQRYDLSTYDKVHVYQFDTVYNETNSTYDIFQDQIKNVLPDVMYGRNIICYAYGQTGSGKTFTTFGSNVDYGLVQLTGREMVRTMINTHNIYISCFEIYNNQAYDMMNIHTPLTIRENKNGDVKLQNLSKHHVNSFEELIHCTNTVVRRRNVGISSNNTESSRSHMAFTIEIKNGGKIVFVDLAGSERAKKSVFIDRKTYRENIEINRSLLALKECINATCSHRRHIPFRDAKLTRILKDSFYNSCKTIMIGTVNCDRSCIADTLNTLLYATSVKYIKKIKRQYEAPPSVNSESGFSAVVPLGKTEDEHVNSLEEISLAVQPEPSMESVPENSPIRMPKVKIPRRKKDVSDKPFEIETYISKFRRLARLESKILDRVEKDTQCYSDVKSIMQDSLTDRIDILTEINKNLGLSYSPI